MATPVSCTTVGNTSCPSLGLEDASLAIGFTIHQGIFSQTIYPLITACRLFSVGRDVERRANVARGKQSMVKIQLARLGRLPLELSFTLVMIYLACFKLVRWFAFITNYLLLSSSHIHYRIVLLEALSKPLLCPMSARTLKCPPSLIRICSSIS